MFKKWGHNEDEGIDTTDNELSLSSPAQSTNTILKGSKLIGDINVTCDLELSGDIEGNISSMDDSSVVIKGTCNGTIETKLGNVTIDGQLNNGNIYAGNNVIITGTFKGGEIKSQGRVRIDGYFEGLLQASEIEIGPDAKGHGNILYKDFISIARGARIEGSIQQLQKELTLVEPTFDTQTVETRRDVKKTGTAE